MIVIHYKVQVKRRISAQGNVRVVTICFLPETLLTVDIAKQRRSDCVLA